MKRSIVETVSRLIEGLERERDAATDKVRQLMSAPRQVVFRRAPAAMARDAELLRDFETASQTASFFKSETYRLANVVRDLEHQLAVLEFKGERLEAENEHLRGRIESLEMARDFYRRKSGLRLRDAPHAAPPTA